MPIRVACIAAFALLVSATAARAQRPVVTENAEEPGRVPYQAVRDLICPRNGNVLDIPFDAVPAGKRLVLTYASGAYRALGGPPRGADPFLSAEPATPGRVYLTLSPSLLAGSSDYVTFAMPVQLFVDAGGTPFAMLPCSNGNGSGAASSPSAIAVTISGYLVSVP